MPKTLIIGLLVTVALVVGIIVLLSRRNRNKQKSLVQMTAEELGYHEVTDAKKNLTDWQGAGLSGGAKKITSAYRSGEIDEGQRAITLLEHRYVVSTGNSAREVKHRVAFTPIPQHWPRVQLKRENLFTRLLARLGYRGVEVEDEQFNRTWRVKTKHREFAELLLTPEVQTMLAAGHHAGWWVLEQGHLSYLEKGTLRPEDFVSMPQTLRELAAAIPPELEVWEAVR